MLRGALSRARRHLGVRAQDSASDFESVARTHAGKVRSLNEDRYIDARERGLWAVADGMGGHRAGDAAAELVIESLARMSAEAGGSLVSEAVRVALEQANADLVQTQLRAGMSGATVVALLIGEGRMTCVWAGDSRAYLLRNRSLRQISKDHSLVQEMVDAGLLADAEAKTHPRANVITRAVGAARELVVDICEAPANPGDIFLLCSDGLTTVVGDKEIATILGGACLERAADDLIDAALDRGAPDNVTVVLIRCSR